MLCWFVFTQYIYFGRTPSTGICQTFCYNKGEQCGKLPVLLYIMTCLVQEGVSQSCFYEEEYTVIQFMDITILKVKSFIKGFMKRHLTVYSKVWTLVPNPILLNLYRVYIDNGYTWNYKIAIALSLILVSCLVRHFSFSK